ncbi:tyrosine-type recombinase/integrase, partial [Desulfosporosinus metallidurans]|uniref:tyrosine-type recombinase/integrase n=1 Tax=Desulfosporosinus metallidurans TaxID=1888891 RepID=UPI00094D1773
MYKTIDILADEFLSYKHGIGYQYNSSEIFLRGFVKFILQKYPDAVVPDKESIQDYLDTKKQNVGALYGTIAVLREFCRYLINQGYEDIYVIPPKRSPKICPEPPYFFAETEISDFFHECDLITPHASFKGRDLVIPALFRLLYCCGLRCKEVRMLKCKDVHLKNGYIDILQSKGPISRRIFITSELSDYLAEYNCCIEKIFPVRIYFFPRTTSESYGSGFISQNFRRIWIQAYPDFEETFTRPRAYDF